MDFLWTALLFSPLIATLVLGLFSLILLARYSVRNFDHWKKLGLPYAKPYPFVGSLIESFINPFHETEMKRYMELGRIYGHFEGNRPLISIGDPKLLREILVKDFHIFSNRRSITVGDDIMDNMVLTLTGEDWKRVRTIITPTFTTGKIKRMLNIFKDCSNTAVNNFKKIAKERKPVDCKKIYGAFSMDVIANAAFSTKLDSHNDPENKFAQEAKKAFTQTLGWRFLVFMLSPFIAKLFKVSAFDPKSKEFFKEVTIQIIEERKRTGKKGNDFLQLLIDTASEQIGSNLPEDVAEEEHMSIVTNYGEAGAWLQGFKSVTNKKLSTNELLAQCVIFFFAGYETTATVLSFASYLLALNTDVQDKLQAEVDEALQQSDIELTYEIIQNLKYLDNVISETMRILPPAVRLERLCTEDYQLGDTGITIPKGMIVTIPNYAMQRDPENFPEPEKFNPDRFSAEERAKRDQYVYLPFGAGPRNCVGMRFALMEIKVCLLNIVANFNIKKHPKTKVPLEWKLGLSILQAKELLLTFEPRKGSSRMK